MKRMACAVALAAGTGLTGVAALPAVAAPSPVTTAAGLQVNIVPPGTVTGDSPIPLDVKFHGGNIRVIELFVDGVRLTKQAITTRDGRGAVHFSLDPTLVSEGSHEILVKAYEADGTCATTTTQVTVAAADLNALARFEWPKRNAEVQGLVPIRIKIDSTITDPYVTYTVDNDFLAFRNYAPYVYNWDTAKVANGLHTIGIEVMDGRTLQVVQKLTLAINVKNVGGFTNINPPANPKAGHVEAGSTVETIQGVAESVLPDPSLGARDAVPGMAHSRAHLSRPDFRRSATPNGVRGNATLKRDAAPVRFSSPVIDGLLRIAASDPNAFVISDFSATRMPASSARIAAPNVHPPVANPGGAHVAPGLAALAADPRELMAEPAKATFGLARQSVHFRRTGGIALRPGTERHAAVRGGIAAPTLPGFKANRPKTFDVAFNNTIINFDVAPRVENGLPLAPFRAIFEHTGGTVKWFNQAKTVRAFDSEHEIEIKIGSKDAKVNNQPLTMETVPYLDHGRTIIPLSFLRDSMNLNVNFDPETGHLTIDRK